jgi:hypothetical protein
MVLLGNNGQEEARFGPFGDSVNLGVRYVHGLCQCTMGMKIILGTPDDTLR